MRRRLRLLLAVAGVAGRDSPVSPGRRPSKSSTAPEWPPSDGQNLLHGHLRPLAERSRSSTRSAKSCPQVKATYGLKICFSVGLLSLEQAARLKACGVDRINHNLNTSERFYPQICTTHSYQDRLDTLRAVRAGRAGNLLRRDRRHGRGRGRRGRIGPAARRIAGRGRAGQFPAADRRHSLGRAQPAQSALLSEGARAVSAGQSALRVADCGRPRSASWPVAAAWASIRPIRSSSAII